MPATQTTLPATGPDTMQGTVRQGAWQVPWLLIAGLVFGWMGLWNKLRVDWTINDQYQYGWFVPPLALALLALRWQDRPPRPSRRVPGRRMVAGAARRR